MLASSRPVTGKGPAGLFVPSLMLLGSALVLGLLFRDSLGLTPFVEYSLLGVGFCGMAALLVWKWNVSRSYGRLDPFELPTWFTINVFVFMVVAGLSGFRGPHSLYRRLQGDYSSLVLALFYVSLGTLALWLGYRFAPTWRRPGVRATTYSDLVSKDEVIQPVVVLWLYAASVGIRLYQIGTGQYSFLQDIGDDGFLAIRQWLFYGAQIWTVVLPAVALAVFGRKAPLLGWTTLCLIILIECVFTFIGGTKGAIIYVMTILVACRLYERGRIPWRLVAVLGVVFIVVFPINALYRPLVVSGSVDTHSVADTSANVARLFHETWLTRPLGENVQVFLDVVMSRQSQLIQSISLAAHVTPETIPFRYGRDYFMLPVYILIPRIIWPEKPILSGSVQFSIDYGGAPANTINSTAVTLFGDLYLNFGLPGILGGMFLLGVLYRWIYGAVREAGSHSKLVLYLGLFTWMTNIEGEIVGVIQGTFQQLIILYVLTSLMYRRAVRLEADSNKVRMSQLPFRRSERGSCSKIVVDGLA